MPIQAIEDSFPSLVAEGYDVTSEEDKRYNCFAWVMGNKTQWWEPSSESGVYWNPDVPLSLAVESFVDLYEREGGYSPCDQESFEDGFEKIALYANADGFVMHAARQAESGRWMSKLGDWEDIEHKTLTALEGRFYGKVAKILKRKVG